MENDNDNIPISGNELSSELTGLNKDQDSQKKKLIGITLGITISIIVVIIIIIAITLNKDKNNNNEELDILAEINCSYDIKSISQETTILSNDKRI